MLERSGLNTDLNRLNAYINEKCAKCGEKYPITVLNIEAVIHHGARDYECLNRKACERRVRRLKRKGEREEPNQIRPEDVISCEESPFEEDIPF